MLLDCTIAKDGLDSELLQICKASPCSSKYPCHKAHKRGVKVRTCSSRSRCASRHKHSDIEFQSSPHCNVAHSSRQCHSSLPKGSCRNDTLCQLNISDSHPNPPQPGREVERLLNSKRTLLAGGLSTLCAHAQPSPCRNHCLARSRRSSVRLSSIMRASCTRRVGCSARATYGIADPARPQGC